MSEPLGEKETDEPTKRWNTQYATVSVPGAVPGAAPTLCPGPKSGVIAMFGFASDSNGLTDFPILRASR